MRAGDVACFLDTSSFCFAYSCCAGEWFGPTDQRRRRTHTHATSRPVSSLCVSCRSTSRKQDGLQKRTTQRHVPLRDPPRLPRRKEPLTSGWPCAECRRIVVLLFWRLPERMIKKDKGMPHGRALVAFADVPPPFLLQKKERKKFCLACVCVAFLPAGTKTSASGHFFLIKKKIFAIAAQRRGSARSRPTIITCDTRA